MSASVLKNRLTRLPPKPGIYLFKNDRNEIIYIGKALSLRDRVRSYLQAHIDPKVHSMLAETAEVDYILTDSEKEAALLENNYIQRYQPRFNLRLKDDKSFPYLKVTVRDRFPGAYFSRRVEADGARYFGPYVPAHQARRTLRLLNRFFGLRSCEDSVFKRRKRPCLEYDLKFCTAPCVGLIDEIQYRENAIHSLLFLEGKERELLPVLRKKMAQAAERQEYEQAAHWRDLIRNIEELRHKPGLISVGREDKDIIGFSRCGGKAAFHVFFMRRGKVSESWESLQGTEGLDNKTLLSRFLRFFYSQGHPLPDTLLLPFPASGQAGLERHLSQVRGKKVRFLIPAKGGNKRLMDLARKNADRILAKKTELPASLSELKTELGLASDPLHIEGFDISNTGGLETVGSSVTFVNGQPHKKEYRIYKVRTVKGPNDVGSLKEVVSRRLSRLKEEGRLPDLILVDGGKGQLQAAREGLVQIGLPGLPVASLAKKNEIVYAAGRKEGLVLSRSSPALRLLQLIRDEAHRFAVAFHRKRRTRTSFGSLLDGLPGLGPQKKKALLTEFKDLEQVKRLSAEELARRIGRRAVRPFLEKIQAQEAEDDRRNRD